MSKGKKVNVIKVVIVVAFFIVIFGAGGLNFLQSASTSEIGYSSGFEGPKSVFHGVAYTPVGTSSKQYYTDFDYGAASLHRFDTVLKFDCDSRYEGLPNIIGGMTSVFIPEDSVQNAEDWVPNDWVTDDSDITNPVNVFEWEIDGKMYYMEQWKLRHYVTFSAEWDGWGEVPATIVGQTGLNAYDDLELWFEMNMDPTWYIEGNGVAYFAIGKIQLAETVIYGGRDIDGHEVDARNLCSVSPESNNGIVHIYYGPFGAEAAETTVYTYDGKVLNPDYFRDSVYYRVDLNSFGVSAGYDYLVLPWQKGDVVTMSFDISVFVIGEWTVQDIEEDPDAYGRFTRSTSGSDAIWDMVTDFLSNPYGWVIIVIALFVLVLIFAPWLFMLFFGD